MAPISRAPPSPRRVLLMDASDDRRSVASSVLRRAGFEVDATADDATCSRLLTQKLRDYEALLVAVDGREALVGLAQSERPTMPVIAWTEGTRHAGPPTLLWLPRPWLPEELVAAVTRATTLVDPWPA